MDKMASVGCPIIVVGGRRARDSRRSGTGLVPPIRDFVGDHGEKSAAAHRAEALSVNSNDHAIAQPNLARRLARHLLRQDLARLQEAANVVEDHAGLITGHSEHQNETDLASRQPLLLKQGHATSVAGVNRRVHRRAYRRGYYY